MTRTGLIRHLVDICLLILTLLLVLFQLTGQALHEYLGTGMLVLIIIHVILNRKWYGGIFRGKYSPVRYFSTAVIIILMILFTLMAWSGITMSRYAFGFLSLRSGTAAARTLHLTLCFWTYIFVCVHVGCHAGIMASKLSGKRMPMRIAFRAVSACFSVCGVISSLRLRLWTYMFMQSPFFFIDDSLPGPVTALQYFSVMWLFIMAGYLICRMLRKLDHHNNINAVSRAKTAEGAQRSGGK